MPAIPKLSISTFATFGDKNAGNVGPKCIFFTPKESNASNTITAFCSYYAMLYAIGRSLTSFNPNISLSFKAITTSE